MKCQNAWSEQRLNKELKSDIQFLEEAKKIESYQMSASLKNMIEYKREKYLDGQFNHLWIWIPEGPRKNELRAKQKRIEVLLGISRLP